MEELFLGIDIGGTEIKLGLFSHHGRLINKWNITTDTDNSGGKITEDIAYSVKSNLMKLNISKERLISAGVAVPGGVSDKSVVNKCVSLGWGVVNVSKELSKRLWDIPVIAENDANAAALGEMWKGAGSAYSSMVLLTIGTDIGCGIILNKELLTGAHNAGGEAGHMIINPGETRLHACGKGGCFGQYASGKGLSALAGDRMKRNLSAKEVVELVNSKDSLAESVFLEYGDILGQGLAIISSIVDPQVFILGGGVSHAGEILKDNVKKSFNKYAFHACRDTEIKIAKLKNEAGIYGAAYLAINNKQGD